MGFLLWKKNLNLIKSNPELVDFFNLFKRDSFVNTFFDFRINIKTYLYLLLKTLLLYPFQIRKNSKINKISDCRKEANSNKIVCVISVTLMQLKVYIFEMKN